MKLGMFNHDYIIVTVLLLHTMLLCFRLCCYYNNISDSSYNGHLVMVMLHVIGTDTSKPCPAVAGSTTLHKQVIS